MIDLGVNWQTALAGGFMAVIAYVSVEIFKLSIRMLKKRLKRIKEKHALKHID